MKAPEIAEKIINDIDFRTYLIVDNNFHSVQYNLQELNYDPQTVEEAYKIVKDLDSKEAQEALNVDWLPHQFQDKPEIDKAVSILRQSSTNNHKWIGAAIAGGSSLIGLVGNSITSNKENLNYSSTIHQAELNRQSNSVKDNTKTILIIGSILAILGVLLIYKIIIK